MNLGDINRRQSFIVFISHYCLRGYDGARGWDGNLHPDNSKGDKFKLCVKGIHKMWDIPVPGMDNCYAWIDLGAWAKVAILRLSLSI